MHPYRRDPVDVRGAHRDRVAQPGWPITVAPNGGTVVFTITVTIRTSEVPVTVHNVGIGHHQPRHHLHGRAPTCNGEDTFEAAPETALITITKSRTPTTPAQGGAITYTVVVTNTSAFTTAHATLTDPVPAHDRRRRGLDGSAHGGFHGHACQRDHGLSHRGRPGDRPGRHGDLHHHAHRGRPLQRHQVTNTATATPGTNTACETATRPARPRSASPTRPSWTW